jgi:hypothetical protein
MMKDTEMQLDTVEIVRGRLADGRTIADSDVHKLVAEIDRLRENITLLDGLWHEYHDAYVLQVEENDRLKNDLEAMGMDADMQAREAGNMEYNARILMDERDQLKESLSIADAACRTYWGWEYGRPGDVDDDDVPDSSLLVKWRRDYEVRTALKENDQ